MTALHPDIIRAQLSALRLQHGELEADEEAWIASLESETDLTELLSRLLDSWRNDESLAGGIAGRIAELELRQERLGQRAKAKREVARTLMLAANVRKLELPEGTLSIRNGGERLEIPDETAVPDEWCKTIKTPEKAKIKEAIKGGLDVNWAGLVRSPESISVRTR